ncbi:MBL fold metallo-hydrolase [Candidatus Poribacteria bacterium]|nr:MBL fold metallo-hydrolase [Candidatus Poribacteria bacterium]
MDVKGFVKNIKWFGHDAFLVKFEGKNVYFDPYQISGGEPADLILVSHDHYDHCSVDDINRIRGSDTVIVTNSSSAKKLKGDVRVVKAGDEITVKGLKIKTVPAYNPAKRFHPKSYGGLGFIVDFGGVKVYHAGDTDLIPEMEGLEVDIALLPVSGTYVMTAEEAAQAAEVIKPKVAIPMHYGAIVGTSRDAERFKQLAPDDVEVVILKKS